LGGLGHGEGCDLFSGVGIEQLDQLIDLMLLLLQHQPLHRQILLLGLQLLVQLLFEAFFLVEHAPQILNGLGIRLVCDCAVELE
jgi:hypothetical protein